MTPLVDMIWIAQADPDLGLPAYETAGSAGLDVRANFAPDLRETGVMLAPMQRILVPLGFMMAVPQGYEAQLRPRSGLALKHGVTLLNAPGTIDSDYRGEVQVLLVNFGAVPYPIRHGERIAQMVFAPVAQLRLQPVMHLSDTKRGAGGFGSTGVL